MGILPSERLLILACSATKCGDARYFPAIKRYDGPLWRTLRTADPNGAKAKAAFLSAHLGFRTADTPIELYDVRMTAEIAARMKAGGLGTRWPRPETPDQIEEVGQHSGMHIHRLCGWDGRQAFQDVALVGGHLYLDVMRHFVGLFQREGYVAANARITVINGPIGLMRRDLRIWLNGDYWEKG